MSEILFADDDVATRQMVNDALRAAGYQVRLARSGREALEELQRGVPDLALLDYRIKADPRLAHLPVLILTAQREVHDRLDGFEAGADDYLAKPFDPRELIARLRALLRLTQRGLDRNPTTGLPGGEAISSELDRRQAGREPFAICYLDLDNFKPFSDRFGFSVCDEVIREVAHTLLGAAGGADTFVGHIGGDDFILLCRPENARRLVEEVQDGFRANLLRHVPRDVVRAGSYRAMDRDGVMRSFPLTRLSVAILRVEPGQRRGLAEIGELIAEIKRRAKRPDTHGIEEAALTAEGALV
jgi:PleD family two-component response regulator